MPSVPDLGSARVLVAGLGVTGRAVVRALQSRAAAVTTLDAAAPDADVRREEQVDLARTDLIVVSPGWPPSHPLLVRAQQLGTAVWSEVELAWQLRVERTNGTGPAPWLAVTGTNGKTTTVGMLTAILRASGAQVAEVGNVGTPVVEAALDPDVDVIAVELSSFQLHFTHSMSAHAAAVLNIAPDHIDWHGSLERYIRDKGRIFERVATACVFNIADVRTRELVERADVLEGARAIGFTLGVPGRSELGLVADVLIDRAFHRPAHDPTRHDCAEELAIVSDLAHLVGPDQVVPAHMIANALAAAALARAHGVAARSVSAGLRAFAPGAHRIHAVRRIPTPGAPITLVDDSKATNAHAAQASLGAFPERSVVWIAGGLTKGATFDDLVRTRRDRMRAAVLIGVDQGDLHNALTRHAPDLPVVSIDPGDTGTVMTRAVAAAMDLAEPGDTVLLAPACASMDQFVSYAARGDAFAEAVREIQDHPSAGG